MHSFLIVSLILLSAVIIVSVILQPSKTDGFTGFISGNTDTFYSKNKSRTRESFLAKVTIISAALFAVVVLALGIYK